jgi:hypothetical protein
MPDPLPPRPSLEWLRKSAKRLLAQLRRERPQAKLAEAQREVARRHGFASWRRLRAHVEALAAASGGDAEDAAALFLRRVATGTIDEVRAMLDAEPGLVDAPGPHPFWGGRPQPLHVAIEERRRDVFDLLLERGADVAGTRAEYDGWSPVMLAADRPAMLEALVAHGARIGVPEALLLADDARLEELLRQGGLPAATPNDGSLIAYARTTRAIDLLLAHGARLDVEDRWGTRPVAALSHLGPAGAPLVRHLVAHGAAVSPAESARIGDLEALAFRAVADPAAVTADPVVIAAVEARQHAIVEWLLRRGADPDARASPPSRHTALHAAAWAGDLRMVVMLTEAGADLHARDDEHDSTPQGWAATAREATKNTACADVAAYLAGRADEG